MFKKTVNLIKEYKGFKINDKVKLIGIQMPRTPGIIKSMCYDKLIGDGKKEVVFNVEVANEDDSNLTQIWPVYLGEIEKV